MFRRIRTLLLCSAAVSILLLRLFSASAQAAQTYDPSAEVYRSAWSALDEETAGLLESFGAGEDDPASLFRLEPSGLLSALKTLFSFHSGEARAGFAAVLLTVVLMAVGRSFAGNAQREAQLRAAGTAAALFTLTAYTARVTRTCIAAVEATSAMAAALTPLYAGLLTLSGEPGSALQVRTGIFLFGQAISGVFVRILPAAAALGSAAAAAGAIAPFGDPGALCGLLTRLLKWGTGFLAAAYTAALSVRSVLAQASDTVSARSVRFLLGGAVPVVGGAIGETLSAVTAGLAPAKSGVGLLAILAVCAVNLPAICFLLQWRLALWGLETAAGILEDPKTARFIGEINGICSAVEAIVIYNGFLYLIAYALMLRVKGGV